MCTLTEGFILCSCGAKVQRTSVLKQWLHKIKFLRPYVKPSAGEQELSEKNKWHLYQRTNQQFLVGELAYNPTYWNQQKEKDQSFKFVTNALNTGYCFDFKYQPMDNDLLRIQVDEKLAIDLVYAEGTWHMNNMADPMESWEHWLINHGKIAQADDVLPSK